MEFRNPRLMEWNGSISISIFSCGMEWNEPLKPFKKEVLNPTRTVSDRIEAGWMRKEKDALQVSFSSQETNIQLLLHR
jgi:hypothetical protein